MENKVPVETRVKVLEERVHQLGLDNYEQYRYMEKLHGQSVKRAIGDSYRQDRAFKYIAILTVCMAILAAFTLYCLVQISILDDGFPVERATEPVVEQTVSAQLTDHPVVDVMAAPEVFIPYDVPLDRTENIIVPALAGTIEKPKIFVPYDVPLEENLQKYICEVADYYGVPRELVFGVANAESGYDPEASACGLMGITEACRPEMELLGVTDLQNPYQNATVGILVLSDKLDTYETAEMALMAYHAGDGGAEEMWFSNGIYSTEYSRAVLAEAERLGA